MGKTLLFLFTFLLLLILPNISALCEEGQIDVNSASLEELDKLSGIGPVKAQAIIDARPFQRLDNLIDVVGIGEVTLANIKQQGLACVKDEQEEDSEEQDSQEEKVNEEDNAEEEQEEEIEEEDENDKEKEIEEEQEVQEENKKVISELQETKITEPEIKTIFLNPKGIKSEINKEELSKNKFATYGLITFGVLLIFLFSMKKMKNEKTEFK
ncbi:MAG: ComEA family DNA-binding protein [Nanobdellota archaeon]